MSLFAKKLYAKSWNNDLCRTSTAYPNLVSNPGTKSLSLSRPSNVCNEEGNCISSANVLSEIGLIASKNCSNSLSTSFSLLSCVMTLGNLAVDLKFWGLLLVPILGYEYSRNPVKWRINLWLVGRVGPAMMQSSSQNSLRNIAMHDCLSLIIYFELFESTLTFATRGKIKMCKFMFRKITGYTDSHMCLKQLFFQKVL